MTEESSITFNQNQPSIIFDSVTGSTFNFLSELSNSIIFSQELNSISFDTESTGGGGGVTVKVSSNDTIAGYLNGKLIAGTYTTLVEGNDGGDETLTVDVDPSTLQTPLNDVYVRQDGTSDLTGDWTISSNSITLTSGELIVGGNCDLGDTTVDSLSSTGNITLLTNNIVMTGDIATDEGRVDDLYCTTLYPTKLGEPLNANSKKITSLATPTVGTDAATKGYVDSLATGLSWIDSVIEFAAVGDAVEANGNRYICNATGGGWTENNVYEWDGSAWTETVALDAMACKVTSEGKFYTYNESDSEWKDMGATFDHNSLLGLQGGQAVQYYHATESEKDNWFIKNVDDTDDVVEGSTNLFYTDAKVNALVQNASSDYTIQGDWTFNNLVACANTPTDDNHLARKKYVDDLLSGFTWQEPVADKDLSAPPGSPTLGDRYIIAGAASNWYNASWGYRQKITIDNTKVAGNETDFPVLINITANANTVFTLSQSTGNDILFTTSDGETKIPHELEEFTTADGSRSLVAWVKSDISGSSDTEIYMYYGNATCGNQQEVTSVWDSNFSVVQHMNSSSGSFLDSTSSDNDGTASGGVSENVTGKIADGASFDGSNDVVTLPSSNDITGDSLANCTIEAWVKYATPAGKYVFAIKRSASQSTLISLVADYTGAGYLGILARNDANTAHTTLDYDGSYNDNAWHHLVATIEGATRKVYVDGSQVATSSDGMASVTGNSAPAAIGAFRDGQLHYSGSIDEARFSKTNRSATWISTQYANQNAPLTFISLGAEETPTASGAWAGHVDDITAWDAIQWTFQTPMNGWAVIVTDEAKQYTWNGSEWVAGTATIAHNDSTGKQGGTTDEYYHLEQGEHTELTQWLDNVVLSGDGETNIGSGDFTTTGDIAVDDITATGIVQTEMVLANGVGSHPSGIGAYLEMYVLSGTTCRLLPYDGSSYYDLAIGDWNAGDPNIMLKTGGAVGINEGSPAAKLHVGGDFIARVTSGNQIEAQYDASNKLGIAVDSAGDVIITASGGDISFSDENLTTTGTVTGGTLTAKTITDGTATLTGGELLDLATIEATTTLNFEIGDVAQINLTDGKLAPTTDNDIDLGDVTHRWKDAYFSGKAYFRDTDLNIASLDDGHLDITADTSVDLNVGSSVLVFGTGTLPIWSQTGSTLAVTNSDTDDTMEILGKLFITDKPTKRLNVWGVVWASANLVVTTEDDFDHSWSSKELLSMGIISDYKTSGTRSSYEASDFITHASVYAPATIGATYTAAQDVTIVDTALYGKVRNSTVFNAAGQVMGLTSIGVDSAVVDTTTETAGTMSSTNVGVHINIDSSSSGASTVSNYGLLIDAFTLGGGETSYGVFDNSTKDWCLSSYDQYILFGDSGMKVGSSSDGELDIVTDGIITLGDGGTTNFSKFESDGTLEFNGAATVWKDINLGAAQLSRPSSSQPDLVNFVDEAGADTGIQTYAFAVGEKIHGSFEMQHDYKEGSDFTFHVHWEGITAPTGTDNVQWRLTYTFAADDATLDAVTTIDSADTIFDTQYEFKRTDLVVISGTNREIGQQMLFTLERVASTGDAYAGDALIATVGIHYEIDTVGSRQIIIK